MIVSLKLEDVRKKGEVEHVFTTYGPVHRVTLSGKNGVGKSTVLEALTFIYTGRDSSGGANPTHLIARGAESLKVTLTTYCHTLSRTLTANGNGTLKYTREGIPTVLTQTELYSRFRWTEGGFMAATIPGYFMRLPVDRQLKLLTSVTPEVDRYAIMADLMGQVPLDAVRELGKLEPEIPHYTKFAFRRLELQKRVAGNQGRIEVYRKALEEDTTKPEYPPEVSTLPAMEKELAALKTYQEELLSYPQKKAQYDSLVEENTRRQKRAEDITMQLSQISLEPDFDIDYGQYPLISFIPLVFPPKPLCAEIPDHDNCPSCGQTIGEKHKFKMQEINRRLLEEYEEKVIEIRTYNEIKARESYEQKATLQGLLDEKEARHKANKFKLKMQEELATQLNFCKPMLLGPEPKMPASVVLTFSKDSYERIRKMRDEYLKSLGAHERIMKNRAVAESNIKDLVQENMELNEKIAFYVRYEDALRRLPEVEASLKKDFFTLANFNVDIGSEVKITSKHGIPYLCLSTGERLRADFEICMRFQMLLRHPPGYIFLDNADLADWVSEIVLPSAMQLFVATVDPSQDTMIVNNCEV